MERFEQPQTVEIEKDQNLARVIFKHLELSAKNPNSPEIKIVVEKQPIVIEEGKSYANSSVLIDPETPRVHEIVTQAEKIKRFPENERLIELLKLLRQHIHYAYKDTLEKVAWADPELAKWVSENTGLSLSSGQTTNVPLSELFEKGYGVCRHLSVAYLYLAQKAGLGGCLMTASPGVIKNVERHGSKEKLFRSYKTGEPINDAHAWVEVKLSDGRWIPVDPSTRIIGDTPEYGNLSRGKLSGQWAWFRNQIRTK